jgi:hypothetical protein
MIRRWSNFIQIRRWSNFIQIRRWLNRDEYLINTPKIMIPTFMRLLIKESIIFDALIVDYY